MARPRGSTAISLSASCLWRLVRAAICSIICFVICAVANTERTDYRDGNTPASATVLCAACAATRANSCASKSAGPRLQRSMLPSSARPA